MDPGWATVDSVLGNRGLNKLLFSFRLAVRTLVRSSGVAGLSILTVATALSMLSIFVVVAGNVSQIASQFRKNVRVYAYVGRDMSASQAKALSQTLSDRPEIESAQFFSSSEAMTKLRTHLGEDATVLEGLPPNVLPPAIEIQLSGQDWQLLEIEKLTQNLQKKQGIEDVRYAKPDIERILEISRFTQLASWILGVALILATVLIVSNTIRLTVYARKDEIDIMRLVGATGAFIRAPFLFEGALQGVIGGAFAVLLLFAFQESVRSGLEQTLSYAYGPMTLHFAPWSLALSLLVGGAVVGLFGSLLAVGRFLRV